MEERLQGLLFELSSSERMAIMLELQRQALKLSALSNRLHLTTPEASRHLKRLNEAMLIQRDAEGLYGLTSFGSLVLSQLSGLDFSARNMELFQEYDASCLPYDFVSRLGELAGGRFVSETFRVLEETERAFREAQEFIWILSDQNLALLGRVLAEKLGSVEFRFILPEGAYLPDRVAPIPSTMTGVQKRVLPKVEITIVVTERQAGFGLPTRGGRRGYRSFIGEDPRFYKWCRDLYLHHWDRAKLFVSK